MSISYMTKSGIIPIPVSSVGVNLDFIKRLSDVEREISRLKEEKATTDRFGLTKLSNSTDATQEKRWFISFGDAE